MIQKLMLLEMAWHSQPIDVSENMVQNLLREKIGDAQMCHSAGTTGKSKSYIWGPNFSTHHRFYDFLFTGSWEKPLSIRFFFDMKRKSRAYMMYDKVLMVMLGNGSTRCEVHISNQNLVCNPECMQLAIQHDPELPGKLFDLDSCTFCFTGSQLFHEQVALFKEAGIKRIKNHMRCWDGGATFFTCNYGNTHWVDMSCAFRVDEEGRLWTTDRWNTAQPFCNYWNGDIVSWSRDGICQCGRPIDNITIPSGVRYFKVGNTMLSYEAVSAIVHHYANTPYVTVGYCDSCIKVGYSSTIDVRPEAMCGIMDYINSQNQHVELVLENILHPIERKIVKVYRLENHSTGLESSD